MTETAHTEESRRIHSIRKTNNGIYSGIILLHAALIPILAYVTICQYGHQPFFTRENQRLWMPVFDAQCTLLSLFLAFGSWGTLYRVAFYGAGQSFLIMNLVWARAWILGDNFNTERWGSYVELASLEKTLIWPLLGAMLLLPLRSLLGAMAHDPMKGSSHFRIADLLLITCSVAAASSWYQAAATTATEFEWRVTLGVAVYRLLMSLGSLGCLLFVFTQRRWLSLLLLAASVSLLGLVLDVFLQKPIRSWSSVAYTITVVIATLVIFRTAGVRLRRY